MTTLDHALLSQRTVPGIIAGTVSAWRLVTVDIDITQAIGLLELEHSEQVRKQCGVVVGC